MHVLLVFVVGQTILCYSVVLWWHPGGMPMFVCCGVITPAPSALLAKWFRWGVCGVTILSGYSRVLWFTCFCRCKIGVVRLLVHIEGVMLPHIRVSR